MSIEMALNSFKNGKLVAIPTETVYGLAAPVNDENLIKKIFSLKERPFFDPLIVHVSSVEMAKTCVKEWSETAQILADQFWPGPLTIILPKAQEISDLITSGLETVGVRWPKNQITNDFITSLNIPLAAPSANKFTKTSPTKSEHVREFFSEDEVFILEGDAGEVGIESTIVEIKDDVVEILRPGMITKDDLQTCLKNITVKSGTPVLQIKAPGQHNIHYRPKFKLALVLKKVSLDKINDLLNTSSLEKLELNSDPVIAARELYQVLRTPVDSEGAYIELLDKSNDSAWDGILNRLVKASTIVIE